MFDWWFLSYSVVRAANLMFIKRWWWSPVWPDTNTNSWPANSLFPPLLRKWDVLPACFTEATVQVYSQRSMHARKQVLTWAAHLNFPWVVSTSHTPLPASGVGVWAVLVVVVLVVMHGCSFSGTIPARLSLTVCSDSLCLGIDTDNLPSVAMHEPVCHHQFVSDRDSCASVLLHHQLTHSKSPSA